MGQVLFWVQETSGASGKPGGTNWQGRWTTDTVQVLGARVQQSWCAPRRRRGIIYRNRYQQREALQAKGYARPGQQGASKCQNGTFVHCRGSRRANQRSTVVTDATSGRQALVAFPACKVSL